MLNRSTLAQLPWWTIGVGIISIGLGIVLGLSISILESPIYAIAGVIGAISALLCLVNPKIGLYLLVAITYLRLSDVLVNYYGAPSIAKPFIALMIGVVLVRWWYHEKPPKGAAKATLLVLAYGLVISLSIFHATDFTAVQEALDDFWKNAVIAIIIVILLTDSVSLRNVIWGLIAMGIFMGTIGVWQYVTGTFSNEYWGYGIAAVENIAGSSNGYRISGPFGDPNFFAQIMLVIVPLSFSRLIEEKNNLLRVIALYSTGISILTVVFTFSRGAFLALILMFILMFYFHPPKPRELIIALIVIIIMIPYIPAEYSDRLLTLDDLFSSKNAATSGDVSFRGRSSEAIAALMMFADNPILGVGVQNYNVYYQKYSRQIGLDQRTEARSAHSLYLEVAAELGLAGLSVLGVIIFSVYRSIIRAWNSLRKIGDKYNSEMILSIGIGISGYLFAAAFIHDAYPRYFWMLVGIGLALPEVARQITYNQENENRSEEIPETE